MNFKVQIAELSDIEQLVELRIVLQKECWQKQYSVEDDKFKIAMFDFFKDHLNKDMFQFIIKDKDQIVAICGIQISSHMPQANDLNGRIGNICNVYTKTEYRKKGMQRQLFSECLKFAQNEGIKLFELISSDDQIVINFYESFGFKRNKNAMWKY